VAQRAALANGRLPAAGGAAAGDFVRVGLLARHVELLQQTAGTTDIAALLFA
jgi:hypothetical protein